MLAGLHQNYTVIIEQGDLKKQPKFHKKEENIKFCIN